MSVLFGHPTGNPNSHHAALAHLEAGRLEAFCVPWMPSSYLLVLLEFIDPSKAMVRRLRRRRFSDLTGAPLIQGRAGEIARLLTRALGRGDEGLSYQANDWLMRTMKQECRRSAVNAVHSYEDCSLWQFAEAKRLGKACIYDMPIGYYPVWQQTEAELAHQYAEWLPAEGLPSSRHVRPQQKREEMSLADVVLAPTRFVEETVRRFHPYKPVARAPYGVDLNFWTTGPRPNESRALRFIYAGQLSLRKGIPFLLDAWRKAGLDEAELELVGSWQLREKRQSALPAHVTWRPPCSAEELRERYRAADVFLFPSFFEGFGLVLLEAMACGLPAIASRATAGPEVMTEACGLVIPVGDLDALVEGLRWFDKNRERIPSLGDAARARAERCTWENYRRCVSKAVAPFA
jgi:glycosyltransferase involved in cell wall biosynthesis